MVSVSVVLSPAERSNLALEAVRRLLIKVDPEGLIGMGAPADEYDELVFRIASDLARGASIDADRMFGPADDWRGTGARDAAIEQLREIQQRVGGGGGDGTRCLTD